MAETRINTECFLPTWEGVSNYLDEQYRLAAFPPYMGGCIGLCSHQNRLLQVSSLHGRVYRSLTKSSVLSSSFLPTWEGVSNELDSIRAEERFPPYMGGCIVYYQAMMAVNESFLPTWEGVSLETYISFCLAAFPPYMGGCIARHANRLFIVFVSSLHGRVYRSSWVPDIRQDGFLPVWEGCIVDIYACM